MWMQYMWDVISINWCAADWMVGVKFPVEGHECFSSLWDHSTRQCIMQDKECTWNKIWMI